MSEWISVKSHKPKDHEHVLVFDTKEGVCCGYIYEGNWSHYPIGSFAGDGCLFNVTHWQCLPQPPEEK